VARVNLPVRAAALALPALALVLDRGLKFLARQGYGAGGPLLNFGLHLNPAGPFSLPLSNFALTLGGLLVLGVLSAAWYGSVVADRSTAALGFALMWVGGASNLMDRLVVGAVVDVLQVAGRLSLNLADCYLAFGLGLVLLCSRTRGVHEPSSPS